ncbi:MAG: Gfo/Idh/MocA family oxidoreductase [Candidatus Thermoplasmatota archaeon]|nr:Gfo/Idh/MocA family oxidoreductase [Candidatus Thermoplasmatota archaeon]MCL5731069.1 Gfo/Idh/MocA family oxidoreductase [Candidatus Thermoplasmatota archaeon]
MKFGIISPGRHFMNRIYPAMVAEGNQVTAICSRHSGNREELAKICDQITSGLDEFSKMDFDAAYISSPNAMHFGDAMACIRAGKDVLLEKPMTLNHTEALKLVESASSAGVKLAIGFHLRFHPAMKEIRELIRNDDIGKIAHITAAWGSYSDRTGDTRVWKFDERLAGGGSLVATSVHVMDSINFISGEKPVELSCMRFPNQVVETTSAITVRYSSFPAHITTSSKVQFPDNALRIYTDTDTLEAEGVYGVEIGGTLKRNGRVFRRYQRKDIYRREIRGFMDLVDGRETEIATGEDGALVTRELEAAHTSSASHVTVKL